MGARPYQKWGGFPATSIKSLPVAQLPLPPKSTINSVPLTPRRALASAWRGPGAVASLAGTAQQTAGQTNVFRVCVLGLQAVLAVGVGFSEV